MSRGFTVAELVTVLAIVAVLAAVALPLVLASLPGYRLRAAARELVIDFKKAKVEAIKRNRDVLIVFSPNPAVNPHPANEPHADYVLCVDADRSSVCDANEERIARVAMPRDVRLTAPNFSNTNTCGYDPRGMPWRNRWGRVDVATADDSRSHRISLSRNGAVRLQ